MSATGLILQLSYRLRRYFWLGWSLARWFGLLLVMVTLWALIRWWQDLWPTVIPGAMLLVLVVVLAWAGRKRYIHFQPVPGTDSLLRDTSAHPSLRTEEMVPTRASGCFTVEGQEQYYVDIEADFETVGTREHIILGRVYPSRFLRFGQWPEHELGWWYIFLQPAMIREMRVGHLHFGLWPRPAVQVLYAPDEESLQTIHFTFSDAQSLRRVWDDLLLDAPPGVVA